MQIAAKYSGNVTIVIHRCENISRRFSKSRCARSILEVFEID